VSIALSLLASLAISDGSGLEFPANLHGTWDANADACQLEYSDYRIEIAKSKMIYWESSGTPEQVYSASANETWIDLIMAGEEQAWKSKLRLVLSDSDQILFVEDIAIPEQDYFKTVWFYHRCPSSDDTKGKNAKN
jgi:hypothetical protein